MNNVSFILLGANLGKKEETLQKTLDLLEQKVGEITLQSAIYQTQPWGVSNQPQYLNQVIQLKTTLNPSDLLATTQLIEKQLGRTRNQKWDARTIDIDILYFNQEIIETKSLIIPHPLLHLRRFTLIPLTEIAANFIHPILQKTNKELLTTCKDESSVMKAKISSKICV